MIKLDIRKVQLWAERLGITNLVLAEQDFRLSYALTGIYEAPALRDSLAFKGGTALNKIYFGKFSRLSVDLDFNIVGHPKVVVKQGATMRKAVQAVLQGQDPAYEFKYDYNERFNTLFARYAPLTGGPKQLLKIDISIRDAVPILGLVQKEIPSPEEDLIRVRTYALDELISSKICALYGRKKGRDAFDVDCALRMELNQAVIRKMMHYHFYLSGNIFSWKLFEDNLRAKAADKRFGQDISQFLRTGVEFDARAAIEKFLALFKDLKEPDERELEFLSLAKGLIGRTTSAKKLAKTAHVVHPLKALMHPLPITAEAAALTVDDIRPEKSR